MKNIVTFTAIAILAFSSNIYSNELIGFYITKPEKVLGFHKPYPEPVKIAIERMTWKMQITDKDIFIWIKKNSDPLVIPYVKDGKYLLGTNQEAEVKVFMPFYVENNQTIHGNFTVFYKTNE
jgi:hypothetical protein